MLFRDQYLDEYLGGTIMALGKWFKVDPGCHDPLCVVVTPCVAIVLLIMSKFLSTVLSPVEATN